MALLTNAMSAAAARRLATWRVVLILTAFVPVQQAWGADPVASSLHGAAATPRTGGATTGVGMPAGTEAPFNARWQAPQPEQAAEVNEQSKEPARVRIGLRLTPFHKIVTRNADGTVSERHIPTEPLRHTLRARLNKVNHFFVGEWHVETEPTKWIRKTRRYEVKLNFYRRYGAFGQLEENVGSVALAGVLDEQQDNVHVLYGVARRRLRDKFGHPYFDVVAGFAPGGAPAGSGPTVSRAERSVPAVPPAGYQGDVQRRF